MKHKTCDNCRYSIQRGAYYLCGHPNVESPDELHKAKYRCDWFVMTPYTRIPTVHKPTTKGRIRIKIVKLLTDQQLNWVGVGEYIEITDETRFHADLKMDSIDDAWLLTAVSAELDIVISSEEAINLHTVGDLVDYLHGKLL